MTPDKQSTENEDKARKDRQVLQISAVISIVAVLLAIVHLTIPAVTVDAIAIALLIIAAAPWLAPLLKSIELPGGWKFEFREFKQEIQQELQKSTEQVRGIAERVEEVAQFVVTGSAPEPLRARLARELSEFRNYMIDLGSSLEGEPPTVEITGAEYMNAHYDPAKNQIVVGMHFVSSDVLFREYTHHILGKARGRLGLEGEQQDAVESGLADYFPCSYQDDPELGREITPYLRQRGLIDKAAIRNLDNTLRLADVPNPTVVQAAGEVWGGAFWEIRKLLGRETADQLLLKVWKESPGGSDAGKKFVQSIAGSAGAHKEAVIANFEGRGLRQTNDSQP